MELRGARLTLVTAGVDDSAELLPAFNGDERFTAISGGPALTLDAAKADIIETLSLPGGAVWRFRETVTGALVGMATTAVVPPPSNGWIAFFIIVRNRQRQGLGSEAATLLEQRFFADPAIARVGLPVHAANAAALAFWEGRGYARGLRRHDQYGNEVWTLKLDRIR